MKQPTDYIEKDQSFTRVIVGFAWLAIISVLAVVFNETNILWAFAFLPNWIAAICPRETKNK